MCCAVHKTHVRLVRRVHSDSRIMRTWKHECVWCPSPHFNRFLLFSQVVLACGEAHRDNVGVTGGRILPVMYAGLSAELKPGDPVLLNDGTVLLPSLLLLY